MVKKNTQEIQPPLRTSKKTKKGKTTDSTSSKTSNASSVKSQDRKSRSAEESHHHNCCNFVKTFIQKQYQLDLPNRIYSSTQRVLCDFASRLYPYKTVSRFDRRVTALSWHPSWSNVLAAGSKSGDIIWWDLNRPDCEQLVIPGLGPGGSISAMKFSTEQPNYIYSSTISGKVMLQDFEGKHNECFIDTLTWENWFTSLDIEPQQNLLVTGDTKGYLYLMSSKDGSLVWKVPKKIHKSKVSHVEFHPTFSDLLVSSSIDHTVKLWDMRMFGDVKDCLCVLQHNKGVNSANFSPNGGTSLLTTDQHSELRVFRGPSWHSQILIPHPHRQFQHLTAIRASWHPCMDVVVVGRYPDNNFQLNDKRSIDFFDGQSGRLCYQLTSPFIPGIVSLNQFNMTGDVLASGMGFHVLVWKAKHDDEDECTSRSSAQIPLGNKTNNRSRSSSSQMVKKEKGKLKGLSTAKKLKSR